MTIREVIQFRDISRDKWRKIFEMMNNKEIKYNEYYRNRETDRTGM